MSSSKYSQEGWEVQVRKGLLDFVTLKILSKQPLHGYGIVRRVCDFPGFTVTESAIYPVLRKLLGEGVLTTTSELSDQGPPRKVYYLTSRGKQRLKSMGEFIRTINCSIRDLAD